MIKIVCNQAEWDAIPADFDGDIDVRLKNGLSIVLDDGNAKKRAWVRARDSSQVTAYGSSRVTAYDSSQVMAYDSSHVTAYDSSQVAACDLSHVMAYGTSRVRAKANSQILRLSDDAKLEATGNARIVTPPTTVEEYADYYGLPIVDGKITL